MNKMERLYSQEAGILCEKQAVNNLSNSDKCYTAKRTIAEGTAFHTVAQQACDGTNLELRAER